MDHAESPERLGQMRPGRAAARKHPPVNIPALRTGAAERFAPGGKGERRLARAHPGVAFFKRNFVNVRFEKTRAAEIVDGLDGRHARSDFAESAEEIEFWQLYF